MEESSSHDVLSMVREALLAVDRIALRFPKNSIQSTQPSCKFRMC